MRKFLFFALLSPAHIASFVVRRFPTSNSRLVHQSLIQLHGSSVPVTITSPPDIRRKGKGLHTPTERAQICIIGGGLSGLAASTSAISAAASGAKVVLLEASDKCGGRVQSDVENGFVFDRGFAVFIEEYPFSKKLLDYEDLKLRRFLPGAAIIVQDRKEPAIVIDPLRKPLQIFKVLTTPVASLMDKIKLVPVILNVKLKNIEDLFNEPETDTMSCLKERWGFSDKIIERFFIPFLEGIFLSPLDRQSSRMCNFVMKMFSDGAASLPHGGMAAVATQLERKAINAGVDVRVNHPVSDISRKESDGTYTVQTADGKTCIETDSIIVATDIRVASVLLAQIDSLESLASLPDISQREVGCLYYAFEGPAPVTDPILILNGIGTERGSNNPVNNICFPSQVNSGYAPKPCGLCSVTVLEDAMKSFIGRENELDLAVRRQLSRWFPAHETDIMTEWQLKKIYYIPNAQPDQFSTSFPASVHGGRNCNEFQGVELPHGLFVCGDHVATSTLNGALESGWNAGKAVVATISKR